MSADFIDSNLFIYLFDETNPGKRDTAQQIIYQGLASGTVVISSQVVQETLHVLTRKLKPGMTEEKAHQFLDLVLRPLWRSLPTPELYHHTLTIQARYGYSFYDALIIAAALEAGCVRLYTEDLHHGQRIEGLTIENPFLA
jgi:predicted nucleic acid-binding protein